MKKLILVTLISFSCLVSFSQGKSSFGIRGGMNHSSLSNTNLDAKSNVYAGVFLAVKFSDYYTFQPELGYSNQGAKAKNGLGNDVEIKYLSLNIANKFFINGSGFHMILLSGLDFDLDDTIIGLVNREHGNDITFIDVTIGVGVGYQFKNGFSIEARYKQGLIDVYSGNWHDFESSQYEYENQLNRVFQVGISYKLNFNNK